MQKNAWFIKINEVLLRSQPEKKMYQIKKEKNKEKRLTWYEMFGILNHAFRNYWMERKCSLKTEQNVDFWEAPGNLN